MRARSACRSVIHAAGAVILLVLLADCGGAGEPHELLLPPAPGPTAGPLTVAAANPRYLADRDGRPVYLTGSHTWNSLQDWGGANPPPVFDYGAFLTLLTSHGHNFTRFFVAEQGSGVAWSAAPVWFSPTLYVRSGPGTALDGGPRYDLDRLNPEYFSRLHERLVLARERGIYVSVMLFNGWSLGTKTSVLPAPLRAAGAGNPWTGHPFNAGNNINGIDGDPGGSGTGADVHTLKLPHVTVVQERYVRAVVDAVSDLDNVLFEICNECDVASEEWQYRMIRLVHEYEGRRAMRHPVGMTAIYPNGDNARLFASPADWIAPGDTATEPFLSDPPAGGSKVILTDTDHEGGIAGGPQWVWRSVCRGLNPVYMDPMRAQLLDVFPMFPQRAPPPSLRERNIAATAQAIRSNLGYARALLSRMDLRMAAPHGELASTGYVLATPGKQYVVFLPGSTAYGFEYVADRIRRLRLNERVTIDLSGSSRQYDVEWLRPVDGRLFKGAAVPGGGRRTLTAPFARDAVLFLSARSVTRESLAGGSAR